MAKNLKIVTVACAGVVAGGLVMMGQVAGDAQSGARHETAVALAVAPPQHMPGADPAVDLAPSLPHTPPLPQRAPDIPTIDMAGATDAVASRPTSVRSGPSETAPMMYGFPAGRAVRVIGSDGAFAHIQDVESGADGWIEKDALASSMLTASIAPRAARVRQAKAEIDTPNPVTGIPKTEYRPMLLGGGSDSASSAKRSGGANFAGFVRRGFGHN